MRLATLSLASVIVLLSGCKDPTPQYKAPTFKAPDLTIPSGKFKYPLNFMVCDKVEPNVSEELNKQPLKLQGVSDLQDTESTDCDGKKTLSPKRALHNFKADLTIDPPAGLKSKVNSALIENTRTCSSRRVTVSAGKNALGSPYWLARPYWMDEQGRIIVGTTDSQVNLQIGLNVASGQNILNITYYGRCLDAVKAGATADGPCEKAEELGRKSVLVTAEIEKREVNGVFSIDTCSRLPSK